MLQWSLVGFTGQVKTRMKGTRLCLHIKEECSMPSAGAQHGQGLLWRRERPRGLPRHLIF